MANIIKFNEYVSEKPKKDLIIDSLKSKGDRILKDIAKMVKLTEANDIRAEIINILQNKNHDIHPKVLDKILNMISVGEDTRTDALDILKSFNIPPKVCEDIFNKIATKNGANDFFTYIKNRTFDFKSILDKGKIDIIDTISKSTGINSDIIKYLNVLTWKTSPAMGYGEALLAIICKGGGMAVGAGDVSINGDICEVKSDGARITGQKGFMGEGSDAGEAMKRALKQLTIDNNIDNIEIPEDPGEYTLNKSGKGWAALVVGKEIVKASKGKVTMDDIINVIVIGLKALFKNANTEQIRDFVSNNINAKGKVDYKKFNSDYFEFNFDYYAKPKKNYEFKYFAVISPVGPALITTPENFKKYLDNIDVRSAPSFTTGAGGQGKAFQFYLK